MNNRDNESVTGSKGGVADKPAHAEIHTAWTLGFT